MCRPLLERLLFPAAMVMIPVMGLLAEVPAGSEDWKDPYSRIDLAYAFGGQIYNDNFFYNPGFSILGAFGIELNDHVSTGIGTGLQYFRSDKFFPLFLELNGHVSKEKSTRTLIFQCGYSFARSDAFRQSMNTRLKGGMYIHAGIGRTFFITDAIALGFQLSYRHQFAELDYELFQTEQYRERINFDFIVFGINFWYKGHDK